MRFPMFMFTEQELWLGKSLPAHWTVYLRRGGQGYGIQLCGNSTVLFFFFLRITSPDMTLAPQLLLFSQHFLTLRLTAPHVKKRRRWRGIDVANLSLPHDWGRLGGVGGREWPLMSTWQFVTQFQDPRVKPQCFGKPSELEQATSEAAIRWIDTT